MVTNEYLKRLEKNGEIESISYYHDVYNNVRPLLDFLTYDVIKSISERIEKTKSVWHEENKDTPWQLNMGWCGNEYIVAIKAYLADVKNKKSTSYTSK